MTVKDVFADVRLRWLALAQFVSVFGDFLAIFAVMSVVSFRLHGSPAQVAGILIAYMLPQAFVGPLAGVYVDRWNVKRTMITSDLLRAILVLFLLRATVPWHIYGVLIAISAISSFFAPAQTIAIRGIVPTEGLVASNAIMMQIFLLTQVISPAVAGVLIKHAGERVCFWLDGASFAMSAVIVTTLALHRQGAAPKAVDSIFADMMASLRFIFTHSVLAFTILSMAAGLFAIRCYSALIAVYVRDILHGSTEMFGNLGSLVGVGMIAGTQLVTKAAKILSKSHLMIGGLVGVAAGLGVLAVVSNTPAVAIATLGIGLSVSMVIIPAQAMMQGQTPIEMLGRVTSSLISVLSLAQVAGLVLSGSIAQWIGIRNSYLSTGGLLLLIAAAGFRSLRRREHATAA